MRTVYLHIGMHKTGSTSIQKNFRGYDDGVTKFAELGFQNHSIPFFTAFSGSHQNYPEWKFRKLSFEEIENKKAECFQFIENSLKSDTNKNLIFSGEDISQISLSGVLEIKKLLSKYADRIVVLAYVRDPFSFCVSLLQEDIRGGINTIKLVSSNYEYRFDKFSQVFGKNNVIFRKFDKNNLKHGDIISDFAEVLNINPPVSSTVENEGMSTEAVRLIYLLNTMVSNSDEDAKLYYAKTRCVHHIKSLFPGKFFVPQEIIEGSINQNDIDWLVSNNMMDRVTLLNIFKFSETKLIDYLGNISVKTIDVLLDFIQSRGLSSNFVKTKENVMFRYYTAFLMESLSYRGFSAARYLELNPDVREAGVNPYQHFLEHGCNEGREY